MKITGVVIRYDRENINTDEIIPARYLSTSDPDQLAAHCMEDLDPDFLKNKEGKDVLVTGRNFGCGSSREHAPIALKAAGVRAVLAPSFARIFFRNAINIGLPIFECPDAGRLATGTRVQIDASAGTVTDLDAGEKYEVVPFPPFLSKLVESGGLVPYAKRRLAERD
ncbi:MAG: 3-isopropylmalate dehydratase small subunit [Promethearchaeota archaeon]